MQHGGLFAVRACGLMALAGCTSGYVRMPNARMEPTIRSGQRIVLDTAAYKTSPAKRWDIVAVAPRASSEADEWFVLRVVGIPGETVGFCRTGCGVCVNDEPLTPPPQIESVKYLGPSCRLGWPITLGQGAYLLFADNQKRPDLRLIRASSIRAKVSTR